MLVIVIFKMSPNPIAGVEVQEMFQQTGPINSPLEKSQSWVKKLIVFPLRRQ